MVNSLISVATTPPSTHAPLYKQVSTSPNFRFTHLPDSSNNPINLSNIIRRLFDLPSNYTLLTNCTRMMDIQFLGLGDIHNLSEIRAINTRVASFFLRSGDDIFTEIDRSDFTDKNFGQMIDIDNLPQGVVEKCWDIKNKLSSSQTNLQLELLHILQRLKYMIKVDVQYLFHKKNKANESFLNISNDLDKIIKSIPIKKLKLHFRFILINKKLAYHAFFKNVCSHNLTPTQNPHEIFLKWNIVSTLNHFEAADHVDKTFEARQNSLIANSAQSLSDNKTSIIVAGAAHLVTNNIIERTLSAFVNAKNFLILSPTLDNLGQQCTMAVSGLPEDVDFSVIHRRKKPFTNIDIIKIANYRINTLKELLFFYNNDGQRIPSNHPKHFTPGPHPKGRIQTKLN